MQHNRRRARWKILNKTVPIIVLVCIFKYLARYLDIEILQLNSLFTALISANVFLVGFLISGTLVDYKESEKIPGEVSASIESMFDEGLIIYTTKKCKEAKVYLNHLLELNNSVLKWMEKKEPNSLVHEKLKLLNTDFIELEKYTHLPFITRLKQEQNVVRKMVSRVKTIRDTSFLHTGYVIAEVITFVLVVGMILIKIDPFYESLFFTSFVSFMLIYMIYLIKDVDNPFEYDIKSGNFGDEISLKPLMDSAQRMENDLENLK